ncbi:TonB-dependent receptor [Kineobactrum salinum]|uniref:TonB-dependent receptor n=1 Tax=Kineobactrum salinum TaxID=2708301 RepID=A0A6C0U1R2_9GAMM|nr:TonB-dependent receptor [Kineobactrum salinum]QIB65946.1 TonB-dependent receptor [Kineobactrum salinum]
MNKKLCGTKIKTGKTGAFVGTLAAITALHSPGSAAQKLELEEIIVTATKTAESVRDIPMSIEAFTGDSLLDRGIVDVKGLFDRTVGVSYSNSRTVIRSVAANTVSNYVVSEETGRFLGDISLNPPSVKGGLADFDPFDMSSVEILKGPQATLFGGAALAGAVRYVPNSVNHNEFEARLRMAYGDVSESDDHFISKSLMLNVPVSEDFGFRFAATGNDVPGQIDDTFSGRNDVNFSDTEQYRAIADWQLSDRWVLTGTYQKWENESETPFTDNPDEYTISTRRSPGPSESEVELFEGRLEYLGETSTVTALVSQVDNTYSWDIDLVPVLGSVGIIPDAITQQDFIDSEADVTSYELRWSSNSPIVSSSSFLNGWSYLFGLYRMEADQIKKEAVVVTAPPALAPFLPFIVPGVPVVPLDNGNFATIQDSRAEVDVTETAFFMDIGKSFLDDKIDLDLGLRYADSSVDSDVYDVFSGSIENLRKFSDDDDRINPSVAITWNIEDDVSLRASASEGFRYGGANAIPTSEREAEGIPDTFGSDSLWNYELALRSDWLDRTLRFDATAFQINWDDLQIVQISDAALNYVDNVGGAEIQGLEYSLQYVVPENTQWVPDGLWLTVSNANIMSETTEAFQSSGSTVEKGSELPLSPKRTTAVEIGWSGNMNNFEMSLSANYKYSGDRKNDLLGTRRLPSYELWGLSARVSNDAWYLRPAIGLTVTNLTNEVFSHTAIPGILNPLATTYVLGAPRTIALNFEISL